MIHENNKKFKEIVIGEIDFNIDNVVNETDVAGDKNAFITKQLGKCKVCVYAGEAYIDHFHVISSDGKTEVCIRLKTIEYFNHAYHHEPFNSKKQCSDLNDWCKKRHKSNDNPKNYTNWQWMCKIWNDNNGDYSVINFSDASDQPNYSLLLR